MEENASSKKEVHDGLLTTKSDLTQDFQTISLMQESINQIQMEVSNILIAEVSQQKSNFELENNQSVCKNRLEDERQHFFLEHKKKLTYLDHEYIALTMQLNNIEDQYLLITQKCDFNVHIIDELKSQENDFSRIETSLESQILQIEAIIESFKKSGIDNKSQIHYFIQKTKNMISQKYNEISIVKQQIQNVEVQFTNIKYQKNNLRQKSNTIQNNIDKIKKTRNKEKTEQIDEVAREKSSQNNKNTKLNDQIYYLKRQMSMNLDNFKEMREIFKRTSNEIGVQREKMKNKIQQIQKTRNEIDNIQEKVGETKEKSSNLLQKHQSYSVIHRKNERMTQKLKEQSEELTKSYKIETKLNQLLPSLIKAIIETDQCTKALDKYQSKVSTLLNKRNHDQENIDKKMMKLTNILLPIEEKIKLAKIEEEDLKLIVFDEDSISNEFYDIGAFPKSEKEEKLKQKIRIFKKEILTILQKIKNMKQKIAKQNTSTKSLTKILKDRASSVKDLYSTLANSNDPIKLIYAESKSDKIERNIKNLEIQIDSKKEILKERNNEFYDKSSMLIHTIHGCNRNELASTYCLDCDPTTKGVVLKDHDYICGNQHEKNAIEILKKIKSSRQMCTLCAPYHTRHENLAVI